MINKILFDILVYINQTRLITYVGTEMDLTKHKKRRQDRAYSSVIGRSCAIGSDLFSSKFLFPNIKSSKIFVQEIEGPVLLEPVRLTVEIRFIDSFRALNFRCTVRYLTPWSNIRGSKVVCRFCF